MTTDPQENQDHAVSWDELLEYSKSKDGERSVVRSRLRIHRAELDEMLADLPDFLARHKPTEGRQLSSDLFSEVALLLVNERGDWQDLIERTVRECGERGFGFVDFLSLANRLAWETRGGTLPNSGLDVTDDKGEPDFLIRAFRLMILLDQRRFVFDQAGMKELLRGLDAAQVGLSTDLLEAFLLHAKIVLNLDGENGESPREHVQRAISLCGRLANTDGLRLGSAWVVCDVLAQALWLGYRLEDQGDSLLQICKSWEKVAGNSQPLIKFRQAAGWRLSGEFDKAIESIDSALQLIHDNSGYGEVFVEQCLREREICVSQLNIRVQIAAARDSLKSESSRLEKSLENTTEKFEEDLRELEKTSLTRTIEIVTLFSSAVAFVLSTVQMAGKVSYSAAEVAPLIILIGTGLASFAGLIVVLMVWSSRRRPGTRSPGSGRELTLVVALVAGIVLLQGLIGARVAREIPKGVGSSPTTTTVVAPTGSNP